MIEKSGYPDSKVHSHVKSFILNAHWFFIIIIIIITVLHCK